MEYKIIKVSDLVYRPIRDIRQYVVEKLKTNIKKDGYNPARLISVIKEDDKYIIADGSHRYNAIKSLGITEVPCAIYDDTADFYTVSVSCNQAEDVYAPIDLFDWLEIIKYLRDDKKLTQEQVATIIKWSAKQVSDYERIIKSTSPTNIELAKLHQVGRGELNSPNGELNFTEGWFREIVGLNEVNQKIIIDEYIKNEGKLKGVSLKEKVKKLKMYEEMIDYIGENIIDTTISKKTIFDDIYNDVYLTMEQLKKYVAGINEKAQTRLINADCLTVINKIPDKTISLLVTDPPYGIDYVSNRRVLESKVTVPIKNDDKKAFELLDKTLELLKSKFVDNPHLYVFCSWKNYPEFKEIISKYHEIKNVIVWDKGNHGAGDLSGNYGERYELIIFAGSGQRNIKYPRPDNIQLYPKVSKLEHPTQKPVELLKFLIEKSSSNKEVIIDPFMGVGSTAVACIYTGNPCIGIEIDEKYFKIANRRVTEERDRLKK